MFWFDKQYLVNVDDTPKGRLLLKMRVREGHILDLLDLIGGKLQGVTSKLQWLEFLRSLIMHSEHVVAESIVNGIGVFKLMGMYSGTLSSQCVLLAHSDIPSNASDIVYCILLAHSAIHGDMGDMPTYPTIHVVFILMCLGA
ncbi:hypothetical protein Dsin_013984 [Dipteronia sinensis]|uniref:Uncharacterized protein n=1 Tax=Dipteronia sinensis TaxID=43782 RepID=A0AAE0E9L9_9ROSI|nr:hypothetical protein Dsin_013984 [Dipteronia sinensis]